MKKTPRKKQSRLPAPRVRAATRRQTDFDAVLRLIDAARGRAAAAVNTALIDLYWQIGEHISRKIADDGTAACERLGDVGGGSGPADLRLDTAALGSMYLGDVPASMLVAAGRVAPASAEALAVADRILPTARKPFCTHEF